MPISRISTALICFISIASAADIVLVEKCPATEFNGVITRSNIPQPYTGVRCLTNHTGTVQTMVFHKIVYCGVANFCDCKNVTSFNLIKNMETDIPTKCDLTIKYFNDYLCACCHGYVEVDHVCVPLPPPDFDHQPKAVDTNSTTTTTPAALPPSSTATTSTTKAAPLPVASSTTTTSTTTTVLPTSSTATTSTTKAAPLPVASSTTTTSTTTTVLPTNSTSTTTKTAAALLALTSPPSVWPWILAAVLGALLLIVLAVVSAYCCCCRTAVVPPVLVKDEKEIKKSETVIIRMENEYVDIVGGGGAAVKTESEYDVVGSKPISVHDDEISIGKKSQIYSEEVKKSEANGAGGENIYSDEPASTEDLYDKIPGEFDTRGKDAGIGIKDDTSRVYENDATCDTLDDKGVYLMPKNAKENRCQE